jgi:biotin operon repressor
MNVTAILWADAQISLSILQKSVLLHLAVLADEAFQVRHSSQRILATVVGCSREAVNKALGNLKARGLIFIAQQFDNDGAQLPCVHGLKVPRPAPRAANDACFA